MKFAPKTFNREVHKMNYKEETEWNNCYNQFNVKALASKSPQNIQTFNVDMHKIANMNYKQE